MKDLIRAISAACLSAVVIFLGCRSMYVQPADDANDFLSSGRTASFFRAVQIDPRAEDSAGPQFVAAGDLNNDGMVDLVSGWNESQPIQIHMQQRTPEGDVIFATLPVGGTTPIARASGLKVADMDQDGFVDIIVLVKDTGLIAQCDQSRVDCDVTDNGGFIEDAVQGAVVIFFNPRDVYTQPWVGITVTQSILAGTIDGTLPEEGGYTGLDVGDIDGLNGPDIVVALNSPEGDPLTGPPRNTIDFYPNPGGVPARNPEGWARIIIHGDRPSVGDCHIADVDGDGDNDVIATFPPAKNSNVRWLPNPMSLGAGGNVYDLWPYFAPVGQVAKGADVIELGDIDGDGKTDLLVRSTDGKVVQWFKKPDSPSQTFIRNPWQVFSIAEFESRAPQAIALGDLTGNGQLDAAIAAQGAVAWLSPYGVTTDDLYDLWQEHLIIDDSGPDEATPGLSDLIAVATDPNADPEAAAGTFVNTLLIVDIDGDGFNDIIATLDRSSLSGLSSDALVMFRNTRGDTGI